MESEPFTVEGHSDFVALFRGGSFLERVEKGCVLVGLDVELGSEGDCEEGKVIEVEVDKEVSYLGIMDREQLELESGLLISGSDLGLDSLLQVVDSSFQKSGGEKLVSELAVGPGEDELVVELDGGELLLSEVEPGWVSLVDLAQELISQLLIP